MAIMMSSANEKLANRMGALMLQVYHDAKKLILSAYSWPSRIVGALMVIQFIFNNEQHNISLDLQYINPSSPHELLQITVDSHRKALANLKNRLHLLYALMAVLAGHKLIIDKDSHEQLLFVGAKEPEETGAAGCLNTLKDSCTETEDGIDFNILQEVSSIVTDGTNMTSGEKGGCGYLWGADCVFILYA